MRIFCKFILMFLPILIIFNQRRYVLHVCYFLLNIQLLINSLINLPYKMAILLYLVNQLLVSMAVSCNWLLAAIITIV